MSTSRYYPYSNDLVHVVGYVGDATTQDIQNKKIEENFVPGLKVGKIGIENSKDTDLIGNHGTKICKMHQEKISEISYNKETQGKNVRTTIDLEIQQLAQELLKKSAGSILLWIYTQVK